MIKRGQLTIFVIVGLLLLALIGLGFIFLREPLPEQNTRIDTQLLITYVESCLQDTAEDALRLAGRQGGQTNLEGRTFNEQMPWLGNTFASGPQRVPYWYHVSTCESPYGCVRFEMPPLCRDETDCILPNGGANSIQENVEEYIESNIKECLNDYSPLENLFSVDERDDPEVEVTFSANDVAVRMLLPLRVEDHETGARADIERFGTNLDVDFEEVYRLAYDVFSLQAQTNFVEENFLHFLSIYQGDPPNPPPFTESSFFGEKKIWTRSETQELIEDEIMPYMNFMQIVNALAGYAPVVDIGVNDSSPYYTYATGIFGYAEMNLGPDKDYPGLGVDFMYPYSGIYLNINDEEVLKGEKIDTGNPLVKLIGFAMTTYTFNYDVAFPILATVHDPDAFGGEGYELTFGLEGNIINNHPYTINRTLYDLRGNKPTVDLNAPEHQIPNTVRIRLLNRHTDEPISNFLLTYECGWSFDIGVTDNEGVWEGSLPYCAAGGRLVAKTTLDYYGTSLEHDNIDENFLYDYDMELWPIITKNITVLRRRPIDIGNYSLGQCNPLDKCRDWLEWGALLNYSTSSINGSSVNNTACTANPANCTTTNTSVPFNQYAVVMLQRHPDTGVDDPLPSVPTLMFGEDLEEVALDVQFEQQHLDQLLADGILDAAQHAVISNNTRSRLDMAFELEKFRDVTLIPGMYDVQAMLYYDGFFTIPKEARKVCTKAFCDGVINKKETVWLPEQNFSVWLLGGAEFVGGAALEFTEAQVYGPDPLVIYVLEQPLPTTWSMLENDYETYQDYQAGKEILAQPEWEMLPNPLNRS